MGPPRRRCRRACRTRTARRPGCPQPFRRRVRASTGACGRPARKTGEGGTLAGAALAERLWVSGLAEDPVEVGPAHGADGLGHPGALVVDADLAACLALGLALHAVKLAAPGLRHDGLLLRDTGEACSCCARLAGSGRRDGDSPGKPAGVLVDRTGDLASHYLRTDGEPARRGLKRAKRRGLRSEQTTKPGKTGVKSSSAHAQPPFERAQSASAPS